MSDNCYSNEGHAEVSIHIRLVYTLDWFTHYIDQHGICDRSKCIIFQQLVLTESNQTVLNLLTLFLHIFEHVHILYTHRRWKQFLSGGEGGFQPLNSDVPIKAYILYLVIGHQKHCIK